MFFLHSFLVLNHGDKARVKAFLGVSKVNFPHKLLELKRRIIILKNNLKIEGLGRLKGIPKLLKFIRISCRGGDLRKEKLKLLQMNLPH